MSDVCVYLRPTRVAVRMTLWQGAQGAGQTSVPRQDGAQGNSKVGREENWGI